MFPEVGERIAFVHNHSAKAMNLVFIHFSFQKIRNKTFPDAAVVEPNKQGMRIHLPVVEIALDKYLRGIGRPYGKVCARCTIHFNSFIAEQFV